MPLSRPCRWVGRSSGFDRLEGRTDPVRAGIAQHPRWGSRSVRTWLTIASNAGACGWGGRSFEGLTRARKGRAAFDNFGRAWRSEIRTCHDRAQTAAKDRHEDGRRRRTRPARPPRAMRDSPRDAQLGERTERVTLRRTLAAPRSGCRGRKETVRLPQTSELGFQEKRRPNRPRARQHRAIENRKHAVAMSEKDGASTRSSGLRPRTSVRKRVFAGIDQRFE